MFISVGKKSLNMASKRKQLLKEKHAVATLTSSV